MDWRIWTESTPIPPQEWEDRLDTLLEELGADPIVLGPVGWGTAEASLGAVFEVEADTIEDAAASGMRSFNEALERAAKGLDDVSVLRFEIAASDYEPDELLGATDVARRLGVSRQRVYQLVQSFADFPRPRAQLARGAVWSRRQVDAWRDRRNSVPWLVELVMHVPRRQIPDPGKQRRMIHELESMYDAHRRHVEANWRTSRDLWARFVVEAGGDDAAGDRAADLLRHKAQYGASIATADDLEVEVLSVEPVDQP